MKENFVIIIESLHLPDNGDQSNVHELPPEKLKLRDVIMVDISGDPVAPSDYKPTEDPSKFHSEKTNRGPLCGKWTQSVRCLINSKFKIRNMTFYVDENLLVFTL